MARLVVDKPRAQVPRLDFGNKKKEKQELERRKSRAEKLFVFQEENADTKTSFGTKSQRLMFPLYVPDNQFGQAMMPKGLELPQVGPGRYDNEEKTSLVGKLDAHVETWRGTAMGGRTAKRFPRNTSDVLFTPAPCEYVSHREWSSKPNRRPFGSSVSSKDRFPAEIPPSKQMPAPGRYEHDVPRDRRPLQHHSFGGPKVLREAASLIRPGPVPKVTRKDKAFVRHGYNYQPDFEERYGKTYLAAFYKQYHGQVDQRLSVLEGMEGRRMLQKKAYLSRYFDDSPPPRQAEVTGVQLEY